MKFFKSLLVAPAALGLLAPMTATANELNLNDVSGYSSSEEVESIHEFSAADLAVTNNRVDVLEVGIKKFEAGSFSETTTMSGAAHFQIGAVDQGASTEAVTSTYSYDIDLNTSFTGEDNLYVGIETGNDSASVDFATDNSGGGNDALSVTSMYYQFPMGNFDVAIGPKLDNDDLLPTITSKYSDSFFFGSQYALPVNFYVLNTTGAGVAVARTLESGWNFSGSIIGTGASSAAGFLTAEGSDVLTLSVGYDSQENYGGGIIWTNHDSTCGIFNSFASNVCTQLSVLAGIDEGMNTTSIGGYWTPNDGNTTFSATTNLIDVQIKSVEVDSLADFQFAIDRTMGNGVFSASWKTFPFVRMPDANESVIKGDDLGSFVEVYYTYDVNDSFQIKPGVSFALPTSDANTPTTDDVAFYLLDRTAVGLEASFKF
tara:strand:- start:232 stop:1518 length:1287 start_codon:yes stop_codon:yes gene_type:complete